jgi:hypothetical protein
MRVTMAVDSGEIMDAPSALAISLACEAKG